jgi:hypothetical protein
MMDSIIIAVAALRPALVLPLGTQVDESARTWTETNQTFEA